MKSIFFSTRKRIPVYFGQYTEKDVENPLLAKKAWRLATSIIKKQRHTIKYLQNKTYRLKKKIKSLYDVIVHLKNSRKISEGSFSVLQV